MTLNKKEKTTILSNIKWLTISKIIVYLLSIITITLIPRYLGVEGYGQLNYILSFVSLFAIFGDLGISTYILREVSKDKKKANSFFNNLILFKPVLLGLFILIVFLATIIVPKDPKVTTLIYLYTFGFLFSLLSTFLLAFFSAFQKQKFRAIYEVLVKFVYTLGVILVIIFNFKIFGVILAHVFSFIVAFLFLFFSINRYIKIDPKINTKFVKKTLLVSSPFILTNIFTTIYFSIDRVFISHFINDFAVGLYSISYTFIGFLTTLLSILHASFLPAMSSFVKNKLKLKVLIKRYLQAIYLFSVPAVIGGIYLSSRIISLVFGSQYLGGKIAFSLILLFFLLKSIGTVNYYLLITNNSEKLALKWLGATAFLNIVLNLFVISLFGIIGAAITTLISEIVLFFGNYNIIKKKIFKINYIKPMIYPLIGSILMLIGLIMFDLIFPKGILFNHFDVLFSIGFGFIIYILFLFFTKVITISKIKEIVGIK